MLTTAVATSVESIADPGLPPPIPAPPVGGDSADSIMVPAWDRMDTSPDTVATGVAKASKTRDLCYGVGPTWLAR